jgi:hypothetical protein
MLPGPQLPLEISRELVRLMSRCLRVAFKGGAQHRHMAGGIVLIIEAVLFSSMGERLIGQHSLGE